MASPVVTPHVEVVTPHVEPVEPPAEHVETSNTETSKTHTVTTYIPHHNHTNHTIQKDDGHDKTDSFTHDLPVVGFSILCLIGIMVLITSLIKMINNMIKGN